MISSFFISIGSSILTLIIGVLPTSSGLSSEITNSLISLSGYINAVSYLFPVGALLSAVSFIVSFEVIWFIFWGSIWVWKRIPFIGK